MKIIGRIEEQDLLKRCMSSGRPEFLVIYGRRRVGKTYLVREYFNHRFAFYATGVANLKTREQLKVFHRSLTEYGCAEKTIPKDWFEAFSRLKSILLKENVEVDPTSGKKVVFLDELPWMDTARSDFKSALDFFWNSWASSQENIALIVCGSATSWIIKNLLRDTGGFFNRITRQMQLRPFTLKECAELYENNGILLSRQQMIESYMIFGGIPYYLNCLDRRLSLAQNVEELCFKESGQLRYEYDRLYSSLFRNSSKHIAIIQALAGKKSGMTRVELAKIKMIGDGEPLTTALAELEQCGFIRKYRNFVKQKQGFFYQVIDPFTLFHISFLAQDNVNSWMTFFHTPGYYAWCGNAFELVCLLHVNQMKEWLGISGVESVEYAWRSRQSSPGAQIDLLIDRKDDIINVCEMKYSAEEYSIDAEYERQLNHKLEIFRRETTTKKALHLTMVTSNGLSHNSHSGMVVNEIPGEAFFK